MKSENIIIDWHKLDMLFIKAVQNMFNWPIGEDYYGVGELFTEEHAFNSVSHDFSDNVGWFWDDTKIVLYASGCSRTAAVYFTGPIYKESTGRIKEIEDTLTKTYKAWSDPYFTWIMQKTHLSIQKLQSKGIPVGKIVFPPAWYQLLGKTKYLFGIFVEEGKHFCTMSPKEYGVYI